MALRPSGYYKRFSYKWTKHLCQCGASVVPHCICSKDLFRAESRNGRGLGACRGLSDSDVERIVAKQYADFCKYRWELASNAPDRRIGLFSKRIFNGGFFDVE